MSDNITGIVNEDSSCTVLARIHAAGANVTQSDVSSISYAIYELDGLDTHTASTSLTVSSVIYDALQTDDRWSKDNTGYNFKHDIAHTVFTTPGRYRIEYKVIMSDASEFYLDPFDWTVKARQTS